MTARLIRTGVRFGFWLALILIGCAVVGWLQSWIGFYSWCIALGVLVSVAAAAAWAHASLNGD